MARSGDFSQNLLAGLLPESCGPAFEQAENKNHRNLPKMKKTTRLSSFILLSLLLQFSLGCGEYQEAMEWKRKYEEEKEKHEQTKDKLKEQKERESKAISSMF